MKTALTALLLVAFIGCEKQSPKDAQLMNAVNAKQELEAEVERLRKQNAALQAALKGKQQPPQVASPPKKLPAGILSMDSKGRPTFSSLKPEAAEQFYSGMHFDKIKQLYGKPTDFKKRTLVGRECYVAGYIVSMSQYPYNIYNPGTERYTGRVMMFYVDMASYKCVGFVFAGTNVRLTPFGKSVGFGR